MLASAMKDGPANPPGRDTLVVALAVAFTLATAPPPARGCDSATCSLLTRGQQGVLKKGQFLLDVSYRFTSVDAKFSGSSRTDVVSRPKIALEAGTIEPAVHQDVSGTEEFVQADLGYGLTRRLTAIASFPLSARRNYTISHVGFTAGYNTAGIGDTLVGLRYALRRGLVVGVAGKLPTGAHTIGGDYDDTILDPTLQPGTGAFDWVPSVQYSTLLRGLGATLGLAASYQMATANDLRYRFGNEGVATASLGRPLTSKLSGSLQMKLYNRGRSRFSDVGVPSTGSTIVYGTAGLRFGAPERGVAYGYVQAPLRRRVNEAQLAPRLALLLGVSKAF